VQLYFLWFEGVRSFWGLTCDFWAENADKKIKAKAKAIKSVALPFGLHSGLRQSGGRFAAALDAGLKAPLYLKSKSKDNSNSSSNGKDNSRSPSGTTTSKTTATINAEATATAETSAKSSWLVDGFASLPSHSARWMGHYASVGRDFG
jgi:hypothetical protein